MTQGSGSRAGSKIETFQGRVESHDYRIEGELFALPNVPLADQLNRSDRPFVPVAHLRLMRPADAGEPAPLGRADFVAVPKDRVRWIVGGRAPEGASPALGTSSKRRVAVLFGSILLRGDLRVAVNIRVSDYIAGRAEARPFDSLYDVELARMERGLDLERLDVLERFEHVTVHLGNATAVAEIAHFGRPRAGDPS